MKLTLVGALVAAVAVATAGAVNQAVTLQLRQYTNANKVRVLVWYGQVSGVGGELVEVQARDCGTKAFYKVAETKPGPGGVYEIESQNPDPPYGSIRWSAAQTYRARWGDQLSEPVPGLRFALKPSVEKVLRRRAWRVRVNHNGLPLNLKLDGKLGGAPAQAWRVVVSLQASATEREAEPRARRVQPRGSVPGADPRPDAPRLRSGEDCRTVLAAGGIGAVPLVRSLALAAIGLALAGGVAAASSQADPVTLSMRQYTNSSKWRVVVWYGQVATSAAGEDVEVLGQACLTKGFRLYTATKTVPGGGYEAESVSTQIPYFTVQVDSGTTFRARWRDQLSNTILHKTPILGFYPVKIPKRRAWKVVVNPAPLYMKLGGKPVVLQRFRAGKWERYKSAPLVLKANYDYGGATNYEAVFETPTRGMRVRAIVPTKTVAPCYLGKTSPSWRT